MHSNVQIAYGFAAALVGVIALGLGTVFALKLRDVRRRRETEASRRRLDDWFTYVLANLAGEEKLYPPPGTLRPSDRLVMQEKLIGWIDQFRGGQQEKLIELCGELGLEARQLKRLGSSLQWVKLDAAFLLGGMRSRQAVPGMMSLLASLRHGPTAFIVARSIAKCARSADELRDMVHLLLAHKKDALPLIADILAESDLDQSAMLETFLRGGDEDRVRLALETMRSRPLPGQALRLYKLISADNADIRLAACRLLLRDPAEATEERTRKLLAHPDERIRAEAAKAQGRLGLERHASLLKKALADPSEAVRDGAARSLARLGDEGAGVLREAAEAEDGPAAEAALAVLRTGKKGPDAASEQTNGRWAAVRGSRRTARESGFDSQELASER